MVRWQPPPPGTQNGEVTGYKIRYRKGVRKSEGTETTSGSTLFKLIDGEFFSDFCSGTYIGIAEVCLAKFGA